MTVAARCQSIMHSPSRPQVFVMPACRRESHVSRQSRRAWWCAVVVCVAAAAGCVVEERVWWSPDGSVAAVDGRPGLRLMRPDGTLSEPILDGQCFGVSWLPDGSGLVVARAIEVATWAEAKPLLPAEEVEAMETAARCVPAVIRAMADLEKVPKTSDEFFRFPMDEAGAWTLFALACARDRHADELRATTRTFWRASDSERELSDEEAAGRWREIQDSPLRVWDLSLVPVANGAAAGPVRSLLRSLRPMSCPTLTPRGGWVAVRLRTGSTESVPGVFASEGVHSLVALDMKGGQRVDIADGVCSNPVWLSDGVTLAFVTVAPGHIGAGQREAIKTLARKTLVAGGPDGMQAGETRPLMAGVFPSSRLALLPGDRLLIPAVEMSLPMRPDAELRPRLFVVDAAPHSKARPAAVNSAAEALPQDLGAFAVSPDGTRAAVVERRTDGVAVVDLATGRVEPVTAASGHECGTLPAWRNDRELLIQTRRPPGDGRDTWAIWQRGIPLRWLDETWTDTERETLPLVRE